MSKQGIFVISLDFELHWGSMDKVLLSEKVKQKLRNTSDIVSHKLALFQENEIHATWATVGMLFNRSAQDWKKNKPHHSERFYKNYKQQYSIENSTSFISNQDNEFLFAPVLINKIFNSVGQELGTHSYGHYCYFDLGSNIEEFKQDLIAAKRIASSNGVEFKSLVFPRNQYDQDCLKICSDLGITNVRTNPNSWYWKVESGDSIIKKIFRTIDNYNIFNLSKVYRLESVLEINQISTFCLPTSRIFKPWKKNCFFLNRLKIERIKREMTFAAKSKSYYHLWWHPENFGDHPVECMKELKKIVNHYNTLRNQYGFASCTMQEAANHLSSFH